MRKFYITLARQLSIVSPELKVVCTLLLSGLPATALAFSLLVIEQQPIFGDDKAASYWQRADIRLFDECKGFAKPVRACISKFDRSSEGNKFLLADAVNANDALERGALNAGIKHIFIAATEALQASINGVSVSGANTPITILADPDLGTAIAVSARRYVKTLRKKGFDARLVVIPAVQKDAFNIRRKQSVFIEVVKIISGNPSPNAPKKFASIVRNAWLWQLPLLDNDDWLLQRDILFQENIKPHIKEAMRFFHRDNAYRLAAFELSTITAFSLAEYRKKYAAENQIEIEKLRYLMLQSHYGNKLVLDWKNYGEYDPIVVVSIDDEDNLFRSPEFYKTHREYSWKETTAPEVSTRLLGAFLDFRKPVPSGLAFPLDKRSAMVFNSIEFFESDPWKDIAALPADLQPVIRNNCIHCHQVNGIGGQSGHITAREAKRQGGYALALEQYPHEVLREFLFNQNEVAKKMGVTPNQVDNATAQALLDWHKALIGGHNT